MSTTAIDRYTSDQYARSNPNWHEEDSPWKASLIAGLLDKHQVRPGRVCEVGCGTGEILRQLQPRLPADAVCHGYDISPHAISVARAKSQAPALEFFEQDFLATDAPRYDLLLLMDVIEHVEDPFQFLRALRGRSALKILKIPLDGNCVGLARNLPARSWDVDGHLHIFTRDTALRTLRLSGYEVLDYSYPPPGPVWTWPARVARLPRRLAFRLAPDVAVRVFGGYSLLVLAR